MNRISLLRAGDTVRKRLRKLSMLLIKVNPNIVINVQSEGQETSRQSQRKKIYKQNSYNSENLKHSTEKQCSRNAWLQSVRHHNKTKKQEGTNRQSYLNKIENC